MDERRVRNVVGVALGVLLVVGFGASRLLGGLPDGGGSAPPGCDDAVAWDDADQVVGQQAAIVGPVASANHEPDVGGAPTFVNLGGVHPDPERFDVVIYEDVRAAFDPPPEDAFEGADVCVRGEVDERDGVPQIVLERREWLTER